MQVGILTTEIAILRINLPFSQRPSGISNPPPLSISYAGILSKHAVFQFSNFFTCSLAFTSVMSGSLVTTVFPFLHCITGSRNASLCSKGVSRLLALHCALFISDGTYQ